MRARTASTAYISLVTRQARSEAAATASRVCWGGGHTSAVMLSGSSGGRRPSDAVALAISSAIASSSAADTVGDNAMPAPRTVWHIILPKRERGS